MKMTDLSILPKMDLGKKYERITAYENKCAIGIIAGDIIGDTTCLSILTTNILPADIYSFGKTINIKTNELNIISNIFDLNGNLIISRKITNKLTIVDMGNYSTGVYVVKLNNDERQYVKRVFIE